MRATAYIPYVDYNPETGFIAQKQLGEREYMETLMSGFDNNTRLLFGDGVSYDPYEKYIGKRKDLKFSYFKCNVMVCNQNSEDENIDKLIAFHRSRKMFFEQLYFSSVDKIEDFQEEMKLWTIDSYKIIHAKKLSEGEKVNALPSKDIKLDFGNNSFAIMHNCKIMEKITPKRYAFMVQEIEFVNGLKLD